MIRTEHREEKWIFPYVKYSPEFFSEKLPLVIQLHGAGERGTGKDDLGIVEFLGFSDLLQHKEYKCITVMPQCPLNSFWSAKVESILKFIDQLISEYDIDERKIYLTGLSMGGYGTWYTAMAAPERFAAIAPVCGGGMAWNAAVLKMPIWVFHGTEDCDVSVIQSDEMVNALCKAGANVTYSRLAGVAHNAWDYAYNSELMEWLLKQEN